jgi:dihydrofolate reductase
MEITLLLTMDENGTIGDGTSIPWNCEAIHKDMEHLIKGNTVIMGRNAYNELKCFRKTRVASRVLFSKSLTTRLKHTSYTTNVFTALSLAKRIDKPVYILGGNQTATSFLNEGVVTNMILYVTPGKHDGIKFIPVGPKSFSLTKIEPKDGYIVKHFVAIPNSQLPVTPLDKMESPPCKKTSSVLSPTDESDVDDMLASVFSNVDYGMDEFGDEEARDMAIIDLANNIDGLYDIIGVYANNQKIITDKLNKVITQDKRIISAQISLQERVNSLDTLYAEKKGIPQYVIIVLLILTIGISVVGMFV